MDEYPGLENYAVGYLNQDWPHFFSDEWLALDAFLGNEPEARTTIVQEIESVLATFASEEETRLFLLSEGCGYAADWDGGTYRGWLEEVARRVTAALGSPPAP